MSRERITLMFMVRYYLVASCLVLAPCVLGAEAGTVTVNAGGNLRAAVQQLHGGDTLLIGPGTYEDGWGELIPSGTASSPTILKATQPRQAIIRSGNGVAIQLSGDQHDSVFDGLVIDKQNEAAGQGLLLYDTAHAITWQNGEVRNFLGTGSCSPSMAFGSSNSQPQLTIENSYIHDIGTDDPPPAPQPCNFSYGIYLSTNGNVIKNNVWANISGWAIHGFPSPQDNVIEGNVFCNTGPVLVQGAGNQIDGNTLYHVGQTVLPWDRGQTLIIHDGNSQSNNQEMADDGICGW